MSCNERSFEFVEQIRAIYPDNNPFSLPSQLDVRIIKPELIVIDSSSFFVPFKKSSAKVTEEYNSDDDSYKISLQWTAKYLDNDYNETINILKNNTLSFIITVFGGEKYLARASDDNYTFSFTINEDAFYCAVEICNASGLQLIL